MYISEVINREYPKSLLYLMQANILFKQIKYYLLKIWKVCLQEDFFLVNVGFVTNLITVVLVDLDTMNYCNLH